MSPLIGKGAIIHSRTHPAIRRIRALQTRRERDRSGLFYTEGVRFVAQAIEQRARVEMLLVAPELLAHPFAKKLVRRQEHRGIRCLQASADVFQSVALSDDPQGIGAVLRQEWVELASVLPAEGLCWVAVSAIHSPGNLGTIIRTADAVGAAGIILIGSEPDPYDPATLRATMGSIFSQRLVRTSPGGLLRWKERHGAALIGTSPAADSDYHDERYPPGLVLLMGGERKGLSDEERSWCDRLVRIPMVGRCDSLNLAVATSVMLYEVFNQQRER